MTCHSYGVRGTSIILETLFKMFPLESMDPDLAFPLSRNDLMSRIILQEAATALIMQDLNVNREQAVLTLMDSWKYGVVQFP